LCLSTTLTACDGAADASASAEAPAPRTGVTTGFPAERDLAILLPLEEDALVPADTPLPTGEVLLPEAWVDQVASAYWDTSVGEGFAEESWYMDWRLVSVRISPCAPLAGSPAQAPASVCWPIVRLVWQPVVPDMTRGGVRIDAWADDRAIHALYPLQPRDSAGARVSGSGIGAVRGALALGLGVDQVGDAEWTSYIDERDGTVAWLLGQVEGLRDARLTDDRYAGIDHRPELESPADVGEAFTERLVGLLAQTARPEDLRELTSFSLPAGRQPSGDDSWVFVQFESDGVDLSQRHLELLSRETGELLLDYGLDQDAGQTRESDAVTAALRADPDGPLHDTVVESSADIDLVAALVVDPEQVFVPNTTCATCHRLNDLRFNFHSLSHFEDEDHTVSPRVTEDVARDLRWVREWQADLSMPSETSE